MFYILFISILIALLLTFIYNRLFSNKFKLNASKMFKNVGISGFALTEISLLFGVIVFKNDLGQDNNLICYSYRDKIKKGDRILITDYDLIKKMYVVDQYPYVK